MRFPKRFPPEGYRDACILSRKLVADHVTENPADISVSARSLWAKVIESLKTKGVAFPVELPISPEFVYVGEHVRFTWQDWTGVAPKQFHKARWESWLSFKEAEKLVQDLAKEHDLVPPMRKRAKDTYAELRAMYNPASGRGPKLKYVPSQCSTLKEEYQGEGFTNISSFLWGKKAPPWRVGARKAKLDAATALHTAHPHPLCRKHNGTAPESRNCQCTVLKNNDEAKKLSGRGQMRRRQRQEKMGGGSSSSGGSGGSGGSSSSSRGRGGSSSSSSISSSSSSSSSSGSRSAPQGQGGGGGAGGGANKRKREGGL